ncbi:helix-turn-helix transcriptional regulator [uncultured Tateyamaria sp.]|uniref:helix-turn-helix domain-containing protein n=1 Tax=uncultured Tateyamaria sp. TaxID=455651 RepID=UPI0026237210|nr:helix-turn-helix transcriptional regulator [uncultured Tateyamaria sp.]
MTFNAWENFGYAVRQARLDMGWTLQKLAEETFDEGSRKGYVSQVERGLRTLKPETIDKFDQALDLPSEIVKAAHLAPPLAKTSVDEDKRDHDAERLLVKAAKDDSIGPVAEALLTTLAYEFAGGQYRDIHTAYTSLRQALEAAEDIRKRGEMPPDNTGSQLNAVMAEVAKLNDLGALEDADALLDAEEKRMREAHKTEKERLDQQAKALLDRRLDQDRLRNDPDAAAARLIKDTFRKAPPGGVFWATNRLIHKWGEDGDAAGDMFALRTALCMAKVNYEYRSKGKKNLEAAALHTLANCHYRIAERSISFRHLTVAKNAIEAALRKTSKSSTPVNWSISQDALAMIFLEMGERTADIAMLRDGVVASRAALKAAVSENASGLQHFWNNFGSALSKLGEFSGAKEPLEEAEDALRTALCLKNKNAEPLNWGATLNNLALAQRWLGEMKGDLAKLTTARTGYAACEALDLQGKAPFDWAVLQWNIADLALARFRLDPDPALLAEARHHVAKARAFFVDGSDYQTERCDELLGQIDAADPGR